MFLIDPRRRRRRKRGRSPGDRIRQVVLKFRLIRFLISAQENLVEVLTSLTASGEPSSSGKIKGLEIYAGVSAAVSAAVSVPATAGRTRGRREEGKDGAASADAQILTSGHLTIL